MDSTRNSNNSYGESCGITPPMAEWMTGTKNHACTGQCAPIHLSARLREFEQHLQQLSMTLPMQDFLWYRNSIATIFTTIWEDNTHAQNNRHS